jgi:lambda family phage portal protein
VLREGVPRNGSGQLSSRLPPDWRVFEASGIRCWWRVDSADGQWMPAGDALVRSSQHVGFHVCARELLARGHDVGPCPECARIQKRAEAFRPGMIEYLKPGEDVKFGAPTSDANYAAYMRAQLHAIAAGLGITYEQLTGDLSQVNYSSLRAGLLEFRRSVETLRWQVFIPQFCVPVWRRFIDRAFLAGRIGKIDYGVSWTPPKFEMIDPLKDAQADTLMMRNGTLTLREAIANRGFDPDQQIEDIAATNQLLDEKKIILDSDPRYTAKSGAVQPTQEGVNDNAKPAEE